MVRVGLIIVVEHRGLRDHLMIFPRGTWLKITEIIGDRIDIPSPRRSHRDLSLVVLFFPIGTFFFSSIGQHLSNRVQIILAVYY